jgi:hypothetical protein
MLIKDKLSFVVYLQVKQSKIHNTFAGEEGKKVLFWIGLKM